MVFEKIKVLGDEYVEYCKHIDEVTFKKMLENFPMHLDSVETIPDKYVDEYKAVIKATYNRLTQKPNHGIVYKEYPSRLDMYGVIKIEDTEYILSIEEMIKYIQLETRQQHTLLIMNPSINRLCKLVFGSSIVTPMRDFGLWLAVHISDTHSNLYRKNIGEEYNEDKLEDEELKASSDWLYDELQTDLYVIINYYVVAQDVLTLEETNKAIISMLLIQIISKMVSEYPEGMSGYDFPSVENILLESKLFKDYLSGLDYKDIKELVNNFFSLEGADTYVYSVCQLALASIDKTHNIETVLYGAIAELCNTVDKKTLPDYLLARKLIHSGKTVNELLGGYNNALQNIQPIRVRLSEIKDIQELYLDLDNLYIDVVKGNTADIYDEIKFSITDAGRELMEQYNINEYQIESKLYKFNNVNTPLKIKTTSIVKEIINE